MPKIIKVNLSAQERTQLNKLRRSATLAPPLRLRLELVRLSDLGLTIGEIAQNLEAHHQTVPKYLHAFEIGKFEALALADKTHPATPYPISSPYLEAALPLLDEAASTGSRTWNLPQVVEWLQQTPNLKVSRGHLDHLLKARRYRYKRTKRSVQQHKKDPDLHIAKVASFLTFNLKEGSGRG
jgi:transposase